MKKLNFGMNFAVFVIFFGVAVLEAVQAQRWLWFAFWMFFGLVFLWADMKKD